MRYMYEGQESWVLNVCILECSINSLVLWWWWGCFWEYMVSYCCWGDGYVALGSWTSCYRKLIKLTFGLILQAYVVLGQFLVLKKDEEMFKDWLKETCGANAKQQGDCHQCLKEWCDNFLWNPLTCNNKVKVEVVLWPVQLMM